MDIFATWNLQAELSLAWEHLFLMFTSESLVLLEDLALKKSHLGVVIPDDTRRIAQIKYCYNRAFLKLGLPFEPWVSILECSNKLDDLGVP